MNEQTKFEATMPLLHFTTSYIYLKYYISFTITCSIFEYEEVCQSLNFTIIVWQLF